jgi:type VII secretion ATPase EccA
MTSSSTTAAARKRFDQAMALFDNDLSAARARFREATEVDPSMADAWLGRIAAGDEALSTLQQLYAYGARLHRETNRLGVRLSAAIKAGPYLSVSVTESSHAGLALASALIDDGQYEKAGAVLDDSALLDSWENHQWQQYVRAYLMFATQRWPDVISVAATTLPPQAIIMSAVTAGTNALAAHAAAHLGQGRVALDWADRVDLRAGHAGPAEARRHQLTDTAVTAIDPNEFPLIAADLAYVRGMAHRQLDEEDKAQIWLSKATINGALIEPAKEALADMNLQLVVTDEETINTRSNKWDVSTERSQQQRREEETEERREELLEQGRALLNKQVGLSEVKRAVAEIEDQIEVRALRMAAGLPLTNQTNHMLLVGPPGTGKTTTAEALGKIYAGLGIVRHPEIIEVKRADFCGEHIGASGPRTNELIARSLGRILFMDEFYSLVERHQDGRPDMIGMEAVNQLLVALEVGQRPRAAFSDGRRPRSRGGRGAAWPCRVAYRAVAGHPKFREQQPLPARSRHDTVVAAAGRSTHADGAGDSPACAVRCAGLRNIDAGAAATTALDHCRLGRDRFDSGRRCQRRGPDGTIGGTPSGPVDHISGARTVSSTGARVGRDESAARCR